MDDGRASNSGDGCADHSNIHNYYSGSFYSSNIGSNGTINNLSNVNQDPTWREVYDWLTEERRELNYLLHQNDLEQRCRSDNSDLGKWFLDSEHFCEWKLGHFRTLFCHGRRKITF